MMSINLSIIAVISIHGPDYPCSISRISTSGAINLMQDIDLTEKSGTL